MDNATQLVDPAVVAAVENAKNLQIGLGVVLVTAVTVGVVGTLAFQKIKRVRAARNVDNIVEQHATN